MSRTTNEARAHMDRAEQARPALALTRYTATKPPRLTKIIGLSESGELHKQAAADLVAGNAERIEVPGLAGLLAVLDALQPSQAVGWGVPGNARPGTPVPVTTALLQAQHEADEPELIARSRKFVNWPAGAGVLMLDHDGGAGDERLSLDELRERLVDACPALADAPMLWRPSASAGIVAPDGRELSGLHKHRLYVPVTRAGDIPEAGKRLSALLWAATKAAPGRYAWAVVGRAGQVLLRSLVDEAVWQPERLDFAAGPILNDGLTRPHAAGRIFGDERALFDLERIAVTPEQAKTAATAKAAARKAVASVAANARTKWADERAPALAQRRGITVEKAHGVLVRAVGDAHVLMGDFELTAQDGSRVAVGEIFDAPDKWHHARFADPLDPDADRRVAFVNLKSGGRPYLWTHRHGGIRFELMRQSARVQIGRGRRIEATDAVLQVLRDRGDLFDYGEGAVAYVAEGRSRPVSPDWLTDHMGRACEFYSMRRKEDAPGNVSFTEVPEDPPAAIGKAVLAKHGSRGFARLVGVVTAPTLRPDGSILDRPGFDAESGLFYWSAGGGVRIPDRPSADDALAALRRLWAPVSLFPLVDDVCRAVVLQGLLTATIRASLPTAPGIGLDAPAAGSGKTLLARCIGILATGTEPAILPPADTDEETRKRLFAALRDGYRVLLWDNVREPLGCAALDSFMTAATFADRVLKTSETASLPNRAMFIATGNNLRLTSDTCRRVLLARMDTQSEAPYTRDFDFCPAEFVARERLGLVADALTIIRAHIAAGRPKVLTGRTASFEAWDDLVRQPLGWLAQRVVEHNDRHPGDALPTFSDPMDAAARAFEADPETSKHAALLEAWFAEFDDMPMSVASGIRRAESAEALATALDEIGGQGGRINSRIVGRWIERMQGRRIGGKWFVRSGMLNGVVRWRVMRDAAATRINPTTPTKPTSMAPAPRGPNGQGESGFSGLSGFVSPHGRVELAAEAAGGELV